MGRIENARSITAVPDACNELDVFRGFKFGEQLAYLLRKRKYPVPLRNLRSFILRTCDWDDGLLVCLPHLVELDITRVAIRSSELMIAMLNIGNLLKKLTLDGLWLCRQMFHFILRFRFLETLSLSMCRIAPTALQWFLTGLPKSPACHTYQAVTGWGPTTRHGCPKDDCLFSTHMTTVMPKLKELDLKYLEDLQASWLQDFHTVRLGLRNPCEGSSAAVLTRDMHIDVRGCRNLSLADLQYVVTTWRGTWFTPSIKALGTGTGAGPVRPAATPLPPAGLDVALAHGERW